MGKPYEKKNIFDVKLIERETTKNNENVRMRVEKGNTRDYKKK